MGASKRSATASDKPEAYGDTRELHKSNLFRMQTDQLLADATAKRQRNLDAALRNLRDALADAAPVALSYQQHGATVSHPELAACRCVNSDVAYTWSPPAHVELVGSYLLGTAALPEANVDIGVEIPSSCLLHKDYLDHRYTDKRLLYLARLGALLGSYSPPTTTTTTTAAPASKGKRARGGAYANDQGLRVASVSLVWLAHLQDSSWPVLQLNLGDDDPWVVRLIPMLAPDAFPPAKLLPSRINLRAYQGSESPSPAYNGRLALESGYAPVVRLLHSRFSLDTTGALRDATILLKVWLQRRTHSQAGGIRGFHLTLILAYLLETRKINHALSAYHVFRVALSFLAATRLESCPILLGADAAGDDAARCAARFGSSSAFVVCAGEAHCNYGLGVTLGAVVELRHAAAASLAALDDARLDEVLSFSMLFLRAQPPELRYDALLSLKSPSAGDVSRRISSAAAAATALRVAQAAADATGAAAATAERTPAESGPPPGSLAPEDVVGCIAVATESLLRHGLGKRAQLVRAWRAPLTEQPLSGGGATTADAEKAAVIHVGLLLDATAATSLVDKGPPAGAESAAAWVAMWGSRSQTRRFKDGSVLHAVVWEAPDASRHLVPLQVARYLLERHLGVLSVVSSLGAVDAALSAPGCGVWHSTAPRALGAFQKLERMLRGLPGLPLAVNSVRSVGPVFSYTEEVPPPPQFTGVPSTTDRRATARFVVTFASSGKWPDDLQAVEALKAAFYLKMATLLHEKSGIVCKPTRTALQLVVDGVWLSGEIQHAGEERLLESAGRTVDADTLRMRTSLAAEHTQAVHALATALPAFAPTARLAKRWLHSQLLTPYFAPPLVELLTACAFCAAAAGAGASERPPASAIAGFVRVLELLASHDFGSEPLLVGLGENGMGAEARARAREAFDAARATGGGPSIWIATPLEPKGSLVCSLPVDGAIPPSKEVLHRVSALARVSLDVVRESMRTSGAFAAAGAMRAEETLATRAMAAFKPPLSDFDALLELDAARAPGASKRLSPSQRRKEKPAFVNLEARATDLELSQMVDTLVARFGELALFFYDGNGGDLVALKWRPAAFMPQPFKALESRHRLMLTRATQVAEKKRSSKQGNAAWLLPDVAGVLEEMRAMSGGLITRVRLT